MNEKRQSFAGAKVRAALIALTCAGALLSSAETVSFQGHEISYTGASATNWLANAATGGQDFVLVFSNTTASGSFTLPTDAHLTEARVLAVGGGGAGGSGARSTSRNDTNNGGNGGGGGGGVVASNAVYFIANSYSVTVGAGGAAATDVSSAVSGESGKASLISAADVNVVYAEGGGGGGAQSAGLNGGNGGGGSQRVESGKTVVGNGGTPVSGGFAGGAGNAASYGGGGGGAGAAGKAPSANVAGAGGAGITNDITGVDVVYGGGGGGGYRGSTTSMAAAIGGEGGGGAGGVATAGTKMAASGADGLGGGGGGGGAYKKTSTAFSIGGAGGSGVVIVRFTAIYAKPTKPEENQTHDYNGTEFVSVEENSAYTITGEWKGTNVGSYTAKVALKPELIASGLTWADGTKGEVDVTMTITQAENKISNLNLESWILGGQTRPNYPTCDRTFGSPKYSWCDSETGTFVDYDMNSSYPTAIGKYYLKATVAEPETRNYKGAEAMTTFYVWANPEETLSDYVDITVTGLAEAETLTNFPVLVRLSESTVHGFLYSRAGTTGEDLVFTFNDGIKNVKCPHEVDTWNTDGESTVWVRVPRVTKETKLKLWWCAKDGAEAPTYVPEMVWREYLGVWHFAGSSEASRFKDSTGNGLTAYLSGAGASYSAVNDSRIGSAIQISSGADHHLLAPDYKSKLDDASRFSFYEWVSAPAYSSATITAIGMQFCGKTAEQELQSGLSDGWAIKLLDKETCAWRWTKGEDKATLKQDLTKTTGAMIGLSVDGTNYTRCAIFTAPDDASQLTNVTDKSFSATPNDEPLRLATHGFAIDEARLAAKTFSQAWLRAEYLTVAEPVNVTYGVVSRDGVLVDWWTTEASITKTTWRVGEEPGVLTSPVPFSTHDVTTNYSNLVTSETYTEMPTDAGCYRVTYSVEGKGGYGDLTVTIDFQIVGQTVTYDDLKGDAATLTLSGRVLLANDDTVDGHAVADQGWWQQRRVKHGREGWKTHTTFWTTNNNHKASVGTCQAGYDLDLSYAAEEADASHSNVIWRLRDVFIGSPYTSTGLGNACSLPISKTSLGISNYSNGEKPVKPDGAGKGEIGPVEAGMMMMRNKVGAAIYSSCYTNGIGTIYFDAVNMDPADGTDCSLVVEVATETIGGLPPTEENSHKVDGSGNLTEFGNIADASGHNCWKEKTIAVLKKDGTDGFVREADTTCVALAVTNGKTRANFYRLAVKVDYRGSCRFRIRRVSKYADYNEDQGRFILLDNIIVSPPPMTADVLPFGTFHTDADDATPGCVGAMDVPFPAIGDSVTGRARIETWSNGAVKDVDPASFVTLANLHYRWRYLAQQEGEWQTSLLAADPADGDLKSVEPMKLPAQEGDVEFWFESYMSVPCYEYFDYSGANLGLNGADGVPLYSESAGDVQTNRYVLAANESLPSYGEDWFFRLRPAKSDYERWRVISCTNLTDGVVAGVAETNDMSLTESGVWRGLVKTLQAPGDGLLKFRFEGLNPQTGVSTNYVYATNVWQAADLDETPGDAAVTAGSGWATAPCDATTGYLLFQLTEPTDDAAGKVSVARADMQNFNKWSSGITTNELFTGSSDNTNSTSLATTTYPMDFAALSPTVATNDAWTQTFNTSSGQVARAVFPRNEPFDSATNRGWKAENAMWICKKWANETASGFGDETSLQLQGCGNGVFTFADNSTMPSGLEKIKFGARVAQYNEFDDFTYYDGDFSSGRATRQTRYTFVTKLALTCGGERSFDGDGSVSLVGAFRPQESCYELRFSRSMSAANLKAELFKWRRESDGTIRATSLGVTNSICTTAKLVHDEGSYGVAFISIDVADEGTKVYGGLYVDADDVAQSADLKSLIQPSDGTGLKYSVVSYYDTNEPLKKGTCGVLARNCPGVFYGPLAYGEIPVITGVTDSSSPMEENVLSCAKSAATAISTASTATALEASDDWVSNSGRTLPLPNAVTAGKINGFQASTNVSQQLVLQLAPVGTATWTDFCTNTVTGFMDQDFDVPVRKGANYNVRFKAGGKYGDVRTDVVINYVELHQWAGQTTANYSADGLPDNFIYQQGWIVEDENSNRVVRLQPARAAKASAPMAVRTRAMEGLGLVGFSWRNADSNAVLHVQYATRDSMRLLKNGLKSLSDAPSDDADDWTTAETIKFADLTKEAREEGSRTVNINVRAPKAGVIRLVVDRDVVTNALDQAVMDENPLHGSVEIAEFFAWDLPAYDKRSWTGWNFRTEGWSASPADYTYAAGPFANLHDAKDGLSGLLNNTLEADTLENPVVDYYKQRQPSVQSPTFMTNCVGVVEFKARLYGTNDVAVAKHPAVVTVYGADQIDANGEPTHWKAVTNVEVTAKVYTTYTMKLKNSENFYALRLGVAGVKDVEGLNGSPETPLYDPPLRVAIDDIYIWEKSKLAVSFRKDHVRPFRSARRLADSAIVDDIDSAEEQPILDETFGFQAEVVVRDTEEILVDDPAHPISVTLWYYPGAEPWGYENWKTNANARRVVLDAADGTNLIFRSTKANTASFCPPQTLGAGEDCRIVQYQMVVTFYDKSGEEFPQEMSASEWAMPSWYEGFDDPNKKNGAAFSPFTVLETIAPKRAWINEVSLVEYSGETDKSRQNQWIELAIPTGVNMTNWTVNVYDHTGAKAATLLTLGKNCPGAKSLDPVNHYEFYVAKGPQSKLSGADATWNSVSSPTFTISSGVLSGSQTYGFELVRPSGIVEHRAVVQGYNFFKERGYPQSIWENYEGPNITEKLNQAAPSGWVWAAEDFKLSPNCTVGVTNGQGQVHADWYSPMVATPGDINEGQVIDPDWFTRPNGGFRWIDAVVRGLHLRQIVENETNTTASISVENGKSTNFVYEVDRWYRLATPLTIVPAETTDATLSGPVVKDRKSYYTLTVNNLTNDVRITAQADVATELEGFLANVGAYKPAIMNWLENGNFEGDTIQLGKYRGATGSEAETQDLTLLGHYWLDLDPTCGGWELWGGMGAKGSATLNPPVETVERVPPAGSGLSVHMNVLTTVWLMITNTVTGVAYPPYRLQGLGNERSDEFGGSWTSATFKVEMRLEKGEWKGRWRAMRHFVFSRNSFLPATDDTAPFSARIEVTDPFSRQSPAWEWGWWKYADQGMAPWARWNLNEEISPGGVTTLKADDTFSY